MGIVANKFERSEPLLFWLVEYWNIEYWLNCPVNRLVASPVIPSKQTEINEWFQQGPNKRGRHSQFEHFDYFLSSYLVTGAHHGLLLVTYILVALYNQYASILVSQPPKSLKDVDCSQSSFFARPSGWSAYKGDHLASQCDGVLENYCVIVTGKLVT